MWLKVIFWSLALFFFLTSLLNDYLALDPEGDRYLAYAHINLKWAVAMAILALTLG